MRAGIAGAGIMGQLLAFSLIREGWDVTIFNDISVNNCSMVAAGLLSPVTELEKNDLIIFELGIHALYTHWPTIIRHLNDDIYFQCLGSLVVSHTRDETELQQFEQLILKKISHNKIFYRIHRDDIHELEPGLHKFDHGYYSPCEGNIDSQTLLTSLKSWLLQRGVHFIENTFVIHTKPHQIILKESSTQFDWVFDCRGLGAKSHFNDLRGLRGELIWLQAPKVHLNRPIRFLHPRYSLYIVPRQNHQYILGASEIEAEDYSGISVLTTLELLTAAYYINPHFSEARMIKTATQCRPTLCHNLPKIKYSSGFMAINGLYRHGFLLAPTLAYDVMQYLQQGISGVCYPSLWEEYE